MSLEQRKQKLWGNHALLVTPMTPAGDIDEQSTRRLVDFVVAKGVHGILALGSTGEVFALTDSERKRFLEIVVDQVRGRVPVGVGVAHSSADASVAFAQHGADLGADYVFTTAPYYHPHSAEGIFRHVAHIANATELPLMLYDGGAGIEISLQLLARLSQALPTLHCAKLFLPYPGKIAQYGPATEGRVQAWAGHDAMNYLMLLNGAKGMTSAASCVLPAEQSAMFESIQAGDIERARTIFFDKVAPLNAIAFANVLQYPQCYKRALKWMGVIEHDTCKVVMEPIDDIRTHELKSVLQRIGCL